MDRVAHLIRTAGETRRAVWASLPFLERFAEVIYRLGSGVQDAFGYGVYDILLEKRVQGLPDIHGQPALEFKGRKPPIGYGREYGHKVYGIMSKKYGPSGLDDAMMDVIKHLYSLHRAGNFDLKPGSTMTEAHSYVMKAVNNKMIDRARKKKTRSETSTSPQDDDEGPGYELVSPDFGRRERAERLIAMMRQMVDKPSVKAELKRIHPSAEAYARLMLQGHQDTEICGNPAKGEPPMLDVKMPSGGKFTPSAWAPYKLKIRKLLLDETEIIRKQLGMGALDIAV